MPVETPTKPAKKQHGKSKNGNGAAVYAIDRVPCRFGNVSIGPEKIGIGVTVERSAIDLERIESAVVGARLDVLLLDDPAGAGDAPGQTKMIDTAEHKIASVADCPSLSVRPEKFGLRLSFQVGSVRVEEIAGIAQKAGLLSMTRIGAMEDEDTDDAGE